MKQSDIGNLLMISNYPSDTAYAWWLMEHFWRTLAERFNQENRQAFLAFPKITSISETIKTAPITPVELSINWQSHSKMKILRDYIRENQISCIYLTDQSYFHPLYARMRLWGVRRIIIHDHTPGDRPPTEGIKGIVKAIYNTLPWITADYVLCVSELMRNRNLTNTRIPAKKCVVVQNGIQPVACAKEKCEITRKELDVRPTSILVISTGRAHHYKRFDFIIKCAKTLTKQEPTLDIVFLLVGDGPAMPDLQNMVHSLDLEKSVRLLGFRTDVHELLCASDIALHAALGEGFSLSITEYMSAGLPVVVPDIPSVNQSITQDVTGLIYSKDDVNEAASSILQLARDTKRRTAMSKDAKSVANTKYTLKKCTDNFIYAIEIGYELTTTKLQR